MIDTDWLILFTVVSFASATVSTVAGLGGGMLLLVALLIGGMPLEVAVPIHGAVQLVANSTRLSVFFKHVRWGPLLVFLCVALPGPILGMAILSALDKDVAFLLFGILILYSTWAPKWSAKQMPINLAFAIAGVMGGVFGVVFGAVGPLITPFMLRDEFSKEAVVATQAISAVFLHALKLVAFGVVGFDFVASTSLIAPMAVAAIAGTFLGKYLLGKISEKTFRRLVRLLLTVLALRMLGASIFNLLGFAAAAS